ncbi:lysophospholipid acyltransferase family protein [Erythrobacter dokdonensis]|uniref:1-acyl-sn-glycerol-3-phosphate acyltransferase n=1 Tax=Erythrobacter dokdonensis DSW-74 TaxID=1300349 RepID=A0A1A7BER5_9SPHN|nr:lysophospholipid acyltransferase family protein [Erythrobacter dokdonensis]OBV10246.1 1-acyl-sn-glycerol-3-phosphate acyltransferase [Erythrobacter dokdonensis DSW-74]
MSWLIAALRSLVFYVLFYGGSALLVAASVVAVLTQRRWLRPVVALWGRWHLWCVEHLLGIEVVLEGALPDSPVLVAIKHESFFEAIDMPRLFAFPAVFAKQELFRIPGWGFSALVYGLIPVAREEGAKTLRQMLATAKERVGQGRPLVIFPEGTRVAHGTRPPLQAGFAGLYKLLRLPVVPVAVDSGRAYHHVVKRPGRITYKVGEVIPAGLAREEIETRVHEAINALNAAG